MGLARDLHLNVKQVLRLPIAYNTAGVSSGVSMGSIPAGAIITAVEANVTTAFNAGTTNVVKVGTAADDDLYLAAADLDETATGFTRYSGKAAGVSTETEILATYTQSGTVATAGAVDLIVEFVTNNG